MTVALREVRVARDGRVVLEIPSLELRDQRTTAILGPNGAGKTTLLRVIAGLDSPGAGTVRVGGVPIQSGRHIAYVFQEQVFLHRSVRQNLELGLRLRGVPRAEIGARVHEAAARLGIAHLLDRRATQLSGGEGRRVSIARALCLKAPLVLLDEPLAGLDEDTYTRLLDELPQLLHAFAATTAIVTHSHHEALRLADDVVVLIGGRVRAAGETRTVFAEPGSAEVAAVLGYRVLIADERRVAVPPDALTLGPGRLELPMIVDQVIDLIERQEVVGRINGTRVHVSLPPGAPVPQPGERRIVSATRFAELA